MATIVRPESKARVLKRAAVIPMSIRDADGKEDGVCGYVNATIMKYGVVDSYRTTFKKGCMDKTKRGKLKAGRIQVFCDHMYGVRQHVGVLRSSVTENEEENCELALFDTDEGRRTKEYLSAVISAKAFTGVSIGFYTREMVPIDDVEKGRIYKYTEIELEEVSITPRPAVPGAEVTGVRFEHVMDEAFFRGLRTQIGEDALQELLRRTSPDEGDEEDSGDAEIPDASANADEAPADASTESDQPSPTDVSMEDRIKAVRESYANSGA